MNVLELFQKQVLTDFLKGESHIQVQGWIVIIDSKLFLLDENLKEPYTDTVKLEISNSEVVFAIRTGISPLGGGKSFVFHRSRIEGNLTSSNPLSIHVQKLSVEEPSGSSHFKEISLDAAGIDTSRKKYGNFLLQPTPNNSDDWLDLI